MPHLTPTEGRVFLLVRQGLTNHEIAATLVVSPTTAKTHIHNLYKKTSVRNRVELARWGDRWLANSLRELASEPPSLHYIDRLAD
ncbi:MAG: response regulator transcription factor [Dehalococcoidia bacterium]